MSEARRLPRPSVFLIRQKFNVSRDDIVHRADDRDPPLPDEVVEGLTLLAHPFNDP